MPSPSPDWIFYGIATAMVAVAVACAMPRRIALPPRDSTTRRLVAFDALGVALLLPLLALVMYARLGDPASLEASRGTGPPAMSDAMDTPGFRASMIAHLQRNPRDARGWVLLARAEVAANRFADAVAAYEKALRAEPRVANDPSVWCEYADALGTVQGGSLAGAPADAIARALALEPNHPRALEMAGGAAFERGDHAAAARHWRALARQLPAGETMRRELELAIDRADLLALKP